MVAPKDSDAANPSSQAKASPLAADITVEAEPTASRREEFAVDPQVNDPEDALAETRERRREVLYEVEKEEETAEAQHDDKRGVDVEIVDTGAFGYVMGSKGGEEVVFGGEEQEEEEESSESEEDSKSSSESESESDEDEEMEEEMGEVNDEDRSGDLAIGNTGLLKGAISPMKESEDVMQINARYFMMDDVVCRNCGLKGHLSYDCTEEEEEKRCFSCGMPGHDAKDCPNEACFYCGESGHRQRDCEVKREDIRNGKYRRTAVHNRSGMKLRKIEPARANMRVVCYVCGRGGHLDCSMARPPPALLSCYNCGKSGHTGSECTDPSVEEMVEAVNEIERSEKRLRASIQRKKDALKQKHSISQTRKISIITDKPKKVTDKKTEKEKVITRKKKKKEAKKALSEAEDVAKKLEEKEKSKEWRKQLNSIVKMQRERSSRRDPRRDPRDRSPVRRIR